MKKEEKPVETSSPQTPKSDDNALAIISIVLGVISLTGPGLLFGIPAIVTGTIALKKKQGERGLSITGIVTGAVSTIISFLLIGFFAFVFIWSLNNPEASQKMERQQAPQQREMLYERS